MVPARSQVKNQGGSTASSCIEQSPQGVRAGPQEPESNPGRERVAPPGAARVALAQGSTVVTLVSTTCSETLETEHRLCKDRDLCLAEERGLGAFRGPQGPRPGRQQEKAALNCSRNLP